MNVINKKELEKLLGYEISDFSVEPKFNDDEFVGLDIKVVKIKKRTVEFINNKITVQKSDSKSS